MQKDLICDFKKEICMNISVLNKLQPMSIDLSSYMCKENPLEKLTQPFFNHLSHYLVSIVDSQACASLPWPLYDTETERLYRSELFNFISDYSNKGLWSSVMSSYLVTPGCYKVVKLLYEMSFLAVERLLLIKMSNDRQKTLYKTTTQKFNSKSEFQNHFLEHINKIIDKILHKFTKYIQKRKIMDDIAKTMLKKIIEMENALLLSNAQNYINDLIDKYVKKYNIIGTGKVELEKIKDVSEQSELLEKWLIELDSQLDSMEFKWQNKMDPFVNLCKEAQQNTVELITIHMGETNKDMYMIEYIHKTDEICTKDLQNCVNVEQKFILKNIVKDGKLNFPYLIRGFLVAICFIVHKVEIGDDVKRFNEYLDNGMSNYMELVSALRLCLDRIGNIEAKLQPSPVTFDEPFKTKRNLAIPLIPDLSDLKSNRHIHNRLIFDLFTPLNTIKHQFNLLRKKNVYFVKPQSTLTTPFHHLVRDDFSKSVLSSRTSSYNHHNISQNFHNMSIVPQLNKINETISDCGIGFTQQQIQRLLSTRKKSSSKKLKFKTKRQDFKLKKGSLFNESNNSNESNALVRSHSSPNLFENREKKSLSLMRRRKLSIMKEDCNLQLEVSGIIALEDNSCGTPPLDSFTSELIITPEQNKINIIQDKDFKNEPIMEENIKNDELKTETPKNNEDLIRKTSSLEKIIKRFKRVKENILNSKENKIGDEFKTIVEEKENVRAGNTNLLSGSRVLLPDLLSPSCNAVSQESSDYLDEIYQDLDEKVRRKPKESLGTALGVDETFLDQFDLID